MSVTLRDVARHLGVSTQTVSAVLNGKSGISAATADRVRQAVAELGYRPNFLASSLRQGYSNAVGLFVDNLANPWSAEYINGVKKAAWERGYTVILSDSGVDKAPFRQSLQILAQFQVAGVIISSSQEIEAVFPNVPFLCQDIVTTDDLRGGYVATAHLIERGHRSIACVQIPNHYHAQQRLQGFRQACQDFGIGVDERLIISGNFDLASGVRAVEHLLQHSKQPTAIFAHQDLIALGVISALKRAGIRVPEDIAVIGYDGLEIAALYDPPLSTIAQPVYETGVRTMTLLADRIEGKDSAPEHLMPLSCELIVRRSTVPDLGEEWHSGSLAIQEPWDMGKKEYIGNLKS